jgi:hypothetical protein
MVVLIQPRVHIFERLLALKLTYHNFVIFVFFIKDILDFKREILLLLLQIYIIYILSIYSNSILTSA